MWNIDDAGRRLEEVIRLAEEKGPQPIAENGKRVAVLLTAEEYRRLLSRKPTDSQTQAG